VHAQPRLPAPLSPVVAGSMMAANQRPLPTDLQWPAPGEDEPTPAQQPLI
jgi:hypothetical protein